MEKYSVEKKIGKGSFGSVYKVLNLNGDHLALKVVKIRSIRHAQEAEKEVEVLKLISKPCMPSLACYYGSFIKEGSLYIEMEFIEGINLKVFAEKNIGSKKFSSFLLAIIADLVPGIKYLHSKGIIHRDIKPENIMIDKKKSQPKLIDVGLACFPKSYLECDGNRICCLGKGGSPSFMAPETLLDGIAYPESDIWSLGVSIYDAATREPLFPLPKNVPAKELIAYLMKEVQYSPVTLLPTGNTKLDELLTLILQKDFTKRISADEILNIIMVDYVR